MRTQRYSSLQMNLFSILITDQATAARRASVPAYPALARGEDKAVMHAMLARWRMLLPDAPWASTYVQTGVNTWAAEHFAAIWTAASFEQAEAGSDAALAALGTYGPHAAYATALTPAT